MLYDDTFYRNCAIIAKYAEPPASPQDFFGYFDEDPDDFTIDNIIIGALYENKKDVSDVLEVVDVDEDNQVVYCLDGEDEAVLVHVPIFKDRYRFMENLN